MRNRIHLIVLAAVLATAGTARAERFTNSRGEVMDCRQVRVAVKSEWGTSSIVGTAVGGAAGGAIGSQFGKGSGKNAATAAGAIGGALAGHEVGKNVGKKYVYRQRCTRVRG